MDTHSRIQELANNSEIEKSRNKSHAKISEFTVLRHAKILIDFCMCMYTCYFTLSSCYKSFYTNCWTDYVFLPLFEMVVGLYE